MQCHRCLFCTLLTELGNLLTERATVHHQVRGLGSQRELAAAAARLTNGRHKPRGELFLAQETRQRNAVEA